MREVLHYINRGYGQHKNHNMESHFRDPSKLDNEDPSWHCGIINRWFQLQSRERRPMMNINFSCSSSPPPPCATAKMGVTTLINALLQNRNQ